MSLQFRSFAFVSFSLFALACGDEADPKAQDKCERLVESYCDRAVSCAQREPGFLDASYTADDLRDDCELAWQTDVDCREAQQVSSQYSDCVSDVKTLSCNNVLNSALPNSCNRVILR